MDGSRGVGCAGYGDEKEGPRPRASRYFDRYSQLASTYRNQGRWREAEELEVHVMETRKTAVGQERPSTLSSIANLACVVTGLLC